MKSKLLIICGPTATGKTKLALRLAKMYKGEILSADSRQIYRGMDVGTGKDMREIEESGVKVWGLDLVDPSERFSVAQYLEVGEGVVEDILGRNRLPIVVGGTGLYIKALIDGIESAQIAPDFDLRSQLEKLSADKLIDELGRVDPERLDKMNMSDRKNPRRLTRAIEIAFQKERLPRRGAPRNDRNGFDGNVLWIGLKMEKKKLDSRIEKRVKKRLEEGFEEEMEGLLTSGVSWEDQSMQALGYQQWRNRDIDAWIKAEQQYAKRQMTWFMKEPRVKWFDVGLDGWTGEVEALVEKWYT